MGGYFQLHSTAALLLLEGYSRRDWGLSRIRNQKQEPERCPSGLFSNPSAPFWPMHRPLVRCWITVIIETMWITSSVDSENHSIGSHSFSSLAHNWRIQVWKILILWKHPYFQHPPNALVSIEIWWVSGNTVWVKPTAKWVWGTLINSYSRFWNACPDNFNLIGTKCKCAPF